MYPGTLNPGDKRRYKGQRYVGSGHNLVLINNIKSHSVSNPASTHFQSSILPNTFTNIYREKENTLVYIKSPWLFLKTDNEKSSPVVNNEN